MAEETEKFRLDLADSTNEFQDVIDNAMTLYKNTRNTADLQQFLGNYGLTIEDARPAFRLRSKGIELTDAESGRAFAQGVTFGFADEIEGAFDAMTSDASYEDARDALRAANKFYAEENPWKANLAEMAGGLVTGGAGLARTAAKQGVKAGVKALAKEGATRGAIEGGIYGVGASDADNVGDMLGDAVVDATIGTVVGGALPASVAGYGNFRGRARGADELGYQMAEEATGGLEGATNKVIRGSGNDMAINTAPSEMLADTSDAARSSLRGMRTNVPEARQVIDQRLDRRYLPDQMTNQGGQLARMRGQLNRVGGQAGETLDDMATRRAREADVSYGRATSTTPEVPAEFLTDYLDNPQFKAAYNQAKMINDNARTLGETTYKLPALSEIFDEDTGELLIDTLPLESVDFIKRGLDSYLGSQSEGISKVIKGQVRQMKNKMLTDVDSLSPEYAAARQQFADTSSLISAGEQGLAFSKVTGPELRQLWKGLNAAEKNAYRQQALESVGNALARPADNADLVKRLAGNVEARENLRLILGDDNYRKLANAFIREMNQVRTRQYVMGGSNTADKMVESRSLDEQFGNALTLLLGQGDLGDAAISGVKNWLTKPRREATRKATEKAADILTETDPNKLMQNVRQSALYRSTQQKRREGVNRTLNALPMATRSIISASAIDNE